MIKVVVVDNDKIVQRSLTGRLNSKCSAFALDGVNIKTLEKEKPDILLIDCVQSNGGGLGLVKQIRDSKKLSSLPIVGLGKDNPRGDIETELLNNFDIDDFISKPLLPQVVCSKIQVLLRERALSGSSLNLYNTRNSPNSDCDTAQKKLNILLIEDNADDVALLYEALKNDFSIRVKNDWRMCKDYLLDESTQLPDTIILDIWFGEQEEGFVAIEWIKSKPKLSLIPIIVLSGAFSADDVAKGLSLGASDYIVKPIRPRVVKDRLWLSHIRSQTSA